MARVPRRTVRDRGCRAPGLGVAPPADVELGGATRWAAYVRPAGSPPSWPRLFGADEHVCTGLACSLPTHHVLNFRGEVRAHLVDLTAVAKPRTGRFRSKGRLAVSRNEWWGIPRSAIRAGCGHRRPLRVADYGSGQNLSDPQNRQFSQRRCRPRRWPFALRSAEQNFRQVLA